MRQKIRPLNLGNCDFAVHLLENSELPSSDLFKYYELMRGYVEHEDNLINSRLTWSLTIHGFLFATLGILTGKIVELVIEIQKSPGPKQPEQLEQVIVFLIFFQVIPAIVGFIVAFYSFRAIRGGHYAIQHLNEIAHVSGPLRIRPSVTSNEDLKEGEHPLPGMDGIKKDMQLIVVSAENTEYVNVIEYVNVKEPEEKTFTAKFTKNHKAPVSFTLQGAVKVGSQKLLLFPRILGGGDRGRYTKGAGQYYLVLPVGMMVAWVLMLAAILIAGILVWSNPGLLLP